jgi:hypothetical protein
MSTPARAAVSSAALRLKHYILGCQALRGQISSGVAEKIAEKRVYAVENAWKRSGNPVEIG